MVLDQGISPPARTTDPTADSFTSDQGKFTALLMVKHARKALDDHQPLNHKSIAIFMHRLDEKPGLKKEVIDYVEACRFDVPRRLLGGSVTFALTWDEGDYRFAIIDASRD